MNILEKIKRVLFNPSKFFLEIGKEKGYKQPLIYISALIIFSSLISLILLFIFRESLTNLYLNIFDLPISQAPLSLGLVTFFVLIGIPIAILLSFVSSGVLYVWLLIFGADKGYHTAYKLLAYSRTPSLLLSWIPFISWAGKIYALILLIIGTHKIYKFSKLKSTLIFVIPAIIIGLLLGILFIFLLVLISLANNQMPQTF